MRLAKPLLSSALIVAAALPCVATTLHHVSASHKKTKTASKPAGQRMIDDSRATQIQGSLIRSGYLSGEPSGHWDTQTEAAMQKYQSDNGWQTKLIPDSRAIIKLGLGPTQTSELNTSSSMPAISSPQTSSSEGFMQK
jgi:peptidoglycan hydrolase-like protein with peptidoglycan-binding domain